MEERFIPKERVDRSKRYPGYVATSRGLLHGALSPVKRDERGDLVFRKIQAPVPGGDIWGVEPSRRRSPQARVESLARRIQYQGKYGMPGSVFAGARAIVDKVGREGLSEDALRDIQAMFWRAGDARSFEECRTIARLYIQQAEKDWEEENRKRVTRKSPYVLDPT